MKIANLVTRFAPASPAAAASVAAVTGESALRIAMAPDWRASRVKIQERLDALHERRGELAATRRNNLVGGVLQDDADAKRTLAQCERDLADADRDISRAQDAAAVADEMLSIDKAKADAETYARAMSEWEAGAQELTALAERADAAALAAATAFSRAAEAAEHLARNCPVELGGAPADRPLGSGRVEYANQMQMAIHGTHWARRGLGIIPWRDADVPSALTTIEAGLAWARGEIDRD